MTRSRVVVLIILLAYSAWMVTSAAVHGVLKWGAMGDYSLYPYVMILGLVCSAGVYLAGRGDKLSMAFILLFFAFGQALFLVEPVANVPVAVRWVFDFIAYSAGCAVIGLGMIVTQRRP